ncbi:MAG: hypothetical protein KGI27_00555 [Thaumarchaeota archaeon]|nr:hypothetical protein [Nitrososphaerota archaeon]
MDISSHDKTAAEIFRVIASQGPITLYATNSVSNMPIGTIHRHFKEMLETQKITVYDTVKSGRKKISYGPTVYGFIYFYGIDSKIRENLGTYFDTWIKKEQFCCELRQAGFYAKKIDQNPKESKKIFGKFVYFYSGVEDQLAHLVKNLNEVPRDVRWFLGGFLLVRKQEYLKAYEDLLSLMPGLRKDIGNIIRDTAKSHNSMKKRAR